MNERISWLLPVKNGMPYLPETLASIENQTYKNWEIIVWDNGSTDGTIEELNRWIPHRLPGRIFTDRHLSVGGSLARMVEICETELCARIDADDINLPERLEKQLDFLLQHPNISVLGSWMYFIDEEGRSRPDLYINPLEHDDIIHEMLDRNAIAHPSVIFKRSAILSVGNYRDRPNIEDLDLWLRVSPCYKIANLNIPLVKYRIHEHSTTQLAIKENRINTAVDRCICENASQTFGCSEVVMEKLQMRSHPFAIIPILKIAHHLNQIQGGNIVYRLRSPSFLKNVATLVSCKDVFSRLFLSCCYADTTLFYMELKSISKSILTKLPGFYLLEKYRSARRNETHERKFNEWIKEIEGRDNTIHSSIEFKGFDEGLNCVKIATGCVIERDFTLWLSSDEGADIQLVIKPKVYIGRNTFIGVFQPIHIGENSLIGAYSYIISGNHSYERRNIPIREQGFTGAPIVIEDDVWIGTHVVILPGVKISKGAIIAAHSLVNQDVPSYEVWGGIPARFLKHRPE